MVAALWLDWGNMVAALWLDWGNMVAALWLDWGNMVAALWQDCVAIVQRWGNCHRPKLLEKRTCRDLSGDSANRHGTAVATLKDPDKQIGNQCATWMLTECLLI